MDIFSNPHRGVGLPGLWSGQAVLPSTDADAVGNLLARCPSFAETPLVEATGLAARAGVSAVHLKDGEVMDQN